jgi:MFS family permease
MTLSLAEPGRTGRRLGQVQAAGAAGSGAGLAAALVLHLLGVRIRSIYVVGAGASLLAAAACLAVPRKIKTPGPRLVLRKRYWLYYLLCFLEGWRKQIVIAFAGFLLVKVHGTPLTTMLLLAAATNGVGWVASPLIGRLIDRLGERRVLVFYYVSLTACFVAYALVWNKLVLYGVFVIDGALFACSMSLTTYVSRIAPATEHTATLSMGVAMNHVAAVAMPLVGGLLWQKLGYKWTFLTGVATAGLSIAASLLVPPRGKGEAPPRAPERPIEPLIADGHLAETVELPAGLTSPRSSP